MASQISFDNKLADVALKRVLNHYKQRPIHVHFAAWLLIGVAFGITMLPNFSVGALIGFGVSGIIFGILIGLLTYPFSGHFSFTIGGALIGAAVPPLFSMTGLCGPISSQGASICLLVGAMIGGTSTIWQSPVMILRCIRKAFANTRIQC